MRVRIRLAGLLASVAAIAMLVPASAQAITVSGTAAPTNLQAGANSDFNLHIAFSGLGETPKDLTIGLPPGEIGDPNAAPFCSVTQLNADSCPLNTKVGDASTMVSLLGLIPNPIPVTGNVYNVEPHPGEPARFGIALHALPLPAPLNTLILPPVILQSGVQVRQTDFGLDTIVNNVPNSAVLIGGTPVAVPIGISSMDLTLFGIAPGTGKPFLRNPTSCAPLHATFTAVPYSGTTGTGQATPFTLTGCSSLPFSPTFSATLDVSKRRAAGEKPTLTTAIDQDNGEAGLRDAKVFIPPAMGADLSRLTPDQACLQADFAAGTCPQVAVLGSALATSPLLTAPLSGPVFLLDNPEGGAAKIGLDLQGQLGLKIQGQLGIDNTTTFSGLPDIPISHFALTFDGGPRGILIASRDLCSPPAPVFHADFAGYNGATTSVDSPATVHCAHALAACKKGKKKRKHNHAAEAKKKKHQKCKKKKKRKKRH